MILQFVTDLEAILHVDLGDTVGTRRQYPYHIAGAYFRMARADSSAVRGVVAFVESVGVTAVCQRIQSAEQAIIETCVRQLHIRRSPADIPVRCAQRNRWIGAAFDLERVDADPWPDARHVPPRANPWSS